MDLGFLEGDVSQFAFSSEYCYNRFWNLFLYLFKSLIGSAHLVALGIILLQSDCNTLAYHQAESMKSSTHWVQHQVPQNYSDLLPRCNSLILWCQLSVLSLQLAKAAQFLVHPFNPFRFIVLSTLHHCYKKTKKNMLGYKNSNMRIKGLCWVNGKLIAFQKLFN